MKLIDNYSPYMGTFTEVSRDKTNGNSLITDDYHKLINFDGVKKKICKYFRGDALSSCDGMILGNDCRYVIEFKNQSEGNVDKAKIKNKAFDSLALIAVNENLTREEISKDTILIIVYNNEKYDKDDKSYSPSKSMDKFAIKLKKLAKMENWDVYLKRLFIQ